MITDQFPFLYHPQWGAIADGYRQVKREKRSVGFNLFSVTSNGRHHENFHSDILASLLDPGREHQEGFLYLHLFITYLREQYQILVSCEDFCHTRVTREEGRLDVLIKDEVSRKAIIIENKINGAKDMEDQLERYHRFAEKNGNYTVVAIIYLSADGLKYAPKSNARIDHLVYNIGCFVNTATDLLNGWLVPCVQASAHADSRSFLQQYINLLKHLSNKHMETAQKAQLYDFLSESNNLQQALLVMELMSQMTAYRAECFIKAINGKYHPFRQLYRYKENYYCFENYCPEDNHFKLDVWFNEDGSAGLDFWNTTLHSPEGRPPLTQELQRIGWETLFDPGHGNGDNGYRKLFKISDAYPNMKALDAAVLDFVEKFIHALG